ncbi:hypothetical protein EUTSA_v10005610mg [Eutrema salsugineum]|uniref:Uncharacterized protein n=1 Tax=Eutrema salsugineum TaxID=72664 RepID=V4KV47_EUTSA|nr:hypothetical protein EUTSA_v10005610mg [Eutrema salsugineum]
MKIGIQRSSRQGRRRISIEELSWRILINL